MIENEIPAEIHRIRAEHAAECGYDRKVLFAKMDADLKRLQAEGWQVVSPPRAQRIPRIHCAKNRPGRRHDAIKGPPYNQGRFLSGICFGGIGVGAEAYIHNRE